MRSIVVVLALVLSGKAAATGEINVLTDLFSPFPPGCVALSLPDQPASADNLLWDEIEQAPAAGSSTANNDVRVQIWRVGCADDGYSVVMVRLTNLSDELVLVPQVFLDTEVIDDLLWHQGQLISTPAVGDIGASGNLMPGVGQTYMLAVDPLSYFDDETLFTVDDYNDEFLLELFWGAFSPAAANPDLFPIASYNPALDPPQFDTPLLHGRMTGAYIFEGKPSAGLFLNVGENFNRDGADDNYVFAAFYTYLDGEPFWMVGSSGSRDAGISTVTMEMFSFSGGDFFTNPPSYTDDDLLVDSVGTLTIEVVDCNNLRLDYDFDGIAGGMGTLDAERLIHIAGYDCNPWN